MWREFSNALRELWEATRGAGGPYRPELHYMRGPGPKWRAKHAVSFATVPVKISRPVPRDITKLRV